MRRFLRDMLIFVTLQAVLLTTFILCYYRRDEDGYMMATVQKHELLSNQPSPRIIFVGGSNLALGLDSSLVAEQLPYHPVNMGLHAGLGLPFMLREIEESLRGGDVVVVVPEYDHLLALHASAVVTGIDLLLAVEARPANIRYLRWGEAKAILDRGAVEYVGGVVRSGWKSLRREPPEHSDVYNRATFNIFGDGVAHWDMAQPPLQEQSILPKPAESEMETALECLLQFQNRCRQRDVTVFFAYPPIPTTEESRDDPDIREFAEILNRRLTIPIINTPEEVFFPPLDFFDSNYHLTREGARKKTELLIKQLRPRLVPKQERIELPRLMHLCLTPGVPAAPGNGFSGRPRAHDSFVSTALRLMPFP